MTENPYQSPLAEGEIAPARRGMSPWLAYFWLIAIFACGFGAASLARNAGFERPWTSLINGLVVGGLIYPFARLYKRLQSIDAATSAVRED